MRIVFKIDCYHRHCGYDNEKQIEHELLLVIMMKLSSSSMDHHRFNYCGLQFQFEFINFHQISHILKLFIITLNCRFVVKFTSSLYVFH